MHVKRLEANSPGNWRAGWHASAGTVRKSSASFDFIRSSFGRMRSRCDSRRGLRRHVRDHLRHLVIAIAWRPVLMRRVMMHLVRARREMRLLWWVARTDRGHCIWLAI